MRAVVLFASCLLACEAGSCGPRVVPPATVGAASSSAPPAAPPPSPTAPFDLASVSPLVAHPALAAVRAAMFAKDPKAASDALKIALDSGKLAGDDVDRGRFLLGRLLVQAKDEDGADVAYSAVREASPLYAHAAVRRAAFAAKRGKSDDALALIAKLPDVPALATDRHFVQGDALSAKGDHVGAAEAYAAERKGVRAVEALIRYAEELAFATKPGDITDDASDKAKAMVEAANGVRRIRFDHPTSTLAPRAEEAERRCRSLLPGALAIVPLPTAPEQVMAAHATLEAGKAKEAVALASKLVASGKKGEDAWCKASMVLARALEKHHEKSRASDVYGDVAAACSDETTRTTALYDGAKLALSLKQPDLARTRFATLETAFPKHRLADDARLRGAAIAIDAGDVAKGEALLASLPDDYPAGDMRTEALFRLALPRMKKGDWAGAIPYLEKSLAIAPREDGYFVAGRALYFLGRAKLETGATADGVAKLHDVLKNEPLSFAAAMAYARLAARGADEATAAKADIDHGIAFEPTGALFDPTRAETKTPAFARGVELARVGETDLARKELATAGLLKDATNDAEAQWLVAAIFARTGDARASHGFPRVRLNDWTHHFPGGKWRTAWELAFPRAYADLVEPEATKQEVPATLVWAVMREESAFDSDATSPSAAYGLLQLIVPTAMAYGKPLKLQPDAKSLLRPDVNVPIGVAYLKKLRNEFPDNPNGLAVPSYNAGEGATHRWSSPPLAPSFDLWVESIPYDETRKYTKRVLASYWAYVALYEPAHLDAELRAAAGVAAPVAKTP